MCVCMLLVYCMPCSQDFEDSGTIVQSQAQTLSGAMAAAMIRAWQVHSSRILETLPLNTIFVLKEHIIILYYYCIQGKRFGTR